MFRVDNLSRLLCKRADVTDGNIFDGLTPCKVCVVGAAGGIGQPLSMLLVKNPLVEHLVLYDLKNVQGVAKDLEGVYPRAKISAYSPEDVDGDEHRAMCKAFDGCDIVVVVAGKTLGPKDTRNDLLKANVKIITKIATAIHESCPETFLAIVTNPVNCLVPVAVTTLERLGLEGAKLRVFGVTNLDIKRASQYVSNHLNITTEEVLVPVVGGHDEKTIVPLLTDSYPTLEASQMEELYPKLSQYVKTAGHQVLEAKNYEGTATLSTALATAEFIQNLLMVKGKLMPSCNVYAFVHIPKDRKNRNGTKSINYFATLANVQEQGVTAWFSVVQWHGLTSAELDDLKAAVAALEECEKMALAEMSN